MRSPPKDRRSIRLKGYDYAQPGAYFVTICTQNRERLFGEIVGDEMQMNDAGRLVRSRWQELPARFPSVNLDTFVVMPNHLHAVIVLGDTLVFGGPGAPTRGAPTPPGVGAFATVESSASSLGTIVGAFKSLTTHDYVQQVKRSGWPSFHDRLWQRNYWEHIVRDENSLNRIREYISTNPLRWHLDPENPERKSAQQNP